MTEVFFAKFPEGDVIAVFPNEPYNDPESPLVMSYQHIGQHGAADINYMRSLPQATHKEYATLQAELMMIGYKDLKVTNKKPAPANYKHITDAGHGWLSVPIQDVMDAGIADQISSCSYISRTRVYLEEDCDAALFLKAANIDGLSIKSTYSECSKVRTYAAYKPDYCGHLRPGSTVLLYNDMLAKVERINPKSIIASSEGYTMRLVKSNPYRYIKAVINF